MDKKLAKIFEPGVRLCFVVLIVFSLYSLTVSLQTGLIQLGISLLLIAYYKIGTKSEADGEEWLLDDTIIARQAEICRQDGIASGCVFFSYSSVFSNEEHNIKQLNNYKEFLQKIKENENG